MKPEGNPKSNKTLGRRTMTCYYCQHGYIPRETDRAGNSAKVNTLLFLAGCLAIAVILPFFGKAWLFLSIPGGALCLFLLADVRKNIPVKCPKCGKHVLYRPEAPDWMKY